MRSTGLNKTECDIIMALANNDLKIAMVAKDVYMSRSGVLYNIGKIIKKTGLNPLRFYELIELVKEVKERKQKNECIIQH